MVGKKVEVTVFSRFGEKSFRVARVTKVGRESVRVRFFETGESAWVRKLYVRTI